jgi:hypothetical protein
MKKTMNLILLSILLVSAFSASADAAIFENMFDSIEDFLDDGWKDSQKIVTFVVLFFLFFSAYLMGMKKAFKDVTRAHIVFAFTAAFLSAFIITTTIEINVEILKWVGIALLAIILLFGIFVALIKMGMEKHKILAFLLALLLTALIIGLILLFVLGDGLDSFKDFFDDVGSLDTGISDVKIGGGGKSDICSRFNGMEFNCKTMSEQGCKWCSVSDRCLRGCSNCDDYTNDGADECLSSEEGEGNEFEGKQELTEAEREALAGGGTIGSGASNPIPNSGGLIGEISQHISDGIVDGEPHFSTARAKINNLRNPQYRLQMTEELDEGIKRRMDRVRAALSSGGSSSPPTNRITGNAGKINNMDDKELQKELVELNNLRGDLTNDYRKRVDESGLSDADKQTYIEDIETREIEVEQTKKRFGVSTFLGIGLIGWLLLGGGTTVATTAYVKRKKIKGTMVTMVTRALGKKNDPRGYSGNGGEPQSNQEDSKGQARTRYHGEGSDQRDDSGFDV